MTFVVASEHILGPDEIWLTDCAEALVLVIMFFSSPPRSQSP